MTPYYSDDAVTLWHHDARRVSEIIEPGSVDLIVTSPPYFALRSYRDGGEHYDGQLGSEATPREFIDNLIECTRDWMTVLRPTGSMFVNLGDKRANDAKWGGATGGKHVTGLHGQTGIGRRKLATGIPAKSRMMLPERYALACLDDLGLLDRQTIIWHKANGLPESVTDRTRDNYEYIYHLTLQGRYYAAIDEIREPHQTPLHAPGDRKMNPDRNDNDRVTRIFGDAALGKVPGSVWTIPSEPLTVPEHLGIDHFAAFPSELPRRCILGWTPPGWCLECGEPRRAVVEKRYETIGDGRGKERYDRIDQGHGDVDRGAFTPQEMRYGRADMTATITGYACACPTPDAPTRPAVVLDPFAGTGTTVAVAKALGRKGIGIDLSRDYLRLAEWRINDPALARKVRDRSGLATPQPPAIDGQLDIFGATA